MTFPILKNCSKTIFLNNGEIAVMRYQIITTKLIKFEVYKKDTTNLLETAYRTFTYIGNQRFGRIGSKSIQCKKPIGKERFKFFDKWHEKQYEFAHKCIFETFPELKTKNYNLDSASIEYYAESENEFT